MNYPQFYLGEDKNDNEQYIIEIWEDLTSDHYNFGKYLNILFPDSSDMTENDWFIFQNDFAIKRNLTRSILAVFENIKLYVSHENFGKYVDLHIKENFDPDRWDYSFVDNLLNWAEKLQKYDFQNYQRAIKEFLLSADSSSLIIISEDHKTRLSSWRV